VLGVLIQPWRLVSDPHVYIYTWLGFYGGVFGSIAGVLIAGYWVLHRTELRMVDLYRRDGAYWFTGGWNWRAVVATVVGALLAVGGAHSNPGEGPFPEGGLIRVLRPLYDYGWVAGLVAGFVVFLALSLPLSQRVARPLPAAGGMPGAATTDPTTRA
jgi:NCS1 family nucleobase:cation symporter-1